MAAPYPDSLSSALRASRNTSLDFLDNLGTSQDSFEPTITTMERIAGRFIEKVKTNLTTGNYQVTGDIGNLAIEIIDDNKLHIVGSIQLLVLNYGISGAFSNAKAPQSPFSYHKGILPPILPFIAWQQFRQLEYRRPEGMSDETFANMTQDDKDKAVAYAVKNAIYRDGRKPHPIMNIELVELEEELVTELTNQSINNVLSMLPLTIGVPSAYNAEGRIPLTGVPIPGLIQSNR
ncbi:hypothetical protein [Pedobacter sp. MR2016-24]|uniref:hypothetical protein n=1 Tax=Pedobacter sp. MR2016-24 TaxID=2994466 RepID=UPI002247D9B7|nr:hypothetical protein [Pedobacter sp. MR2016-24]MCX2486598.1 hypothetical protein [Pedobacter sp. MR2016-24]